MHRSLKLSGFTLIELLVTLAIFGILLGIELPNSQFYMQVTYRQQAKINLTTVSLLQTDNFSRHQQYVELDDLAVNLASDKYQYTINIAGTNQYKITATAINQQRADLECRELSLDHNLTREPEACW